MRPRRSVLALQLAATALLALAPLAARAQGEAPPQAAPAPPDGAAPPRVRGAGAPSAAPGAAPEEPPMTEEIVVTGTRSPRPLRDVPAAVTVIPRAEIERSPSKTTDELLRSAPSFGLFRRSSSLAADPSSQGVKLRNVGGTGVSRALVLFDGIPMNEPYAGWVPWRAFPRIGVDRIEVVPGGGSALYGNFGLGGVIQVFSRPVEPGALELNADYGSFQTAVLDVRASDRWGPLGAAVEGELANSNGYPVVADDQRGAIDRSTWSEHAAVNGRVEADVTPQLRLEARGGFFYEDLNGGTRFTTASTRMFQYALAAHYRATGMGAVDLTIFGHRDTFWQNRTRVLGAGRNAEEQSAHQTVPADDYGGSLVWRSPPLQLGGVHTLLAGSDLRYVKGSTLETLYPPSAQPPAASALTERDTDAKQWLVGVFAQDLYDFSEAFGATLALRYDRWVNPAATQALTTVGGATPPPPFASRSGGELSPKLGLRARLADDLSARAAVYRAFRAPTLDELYRPFQVGTVVTAANPALNPETLTGGELGLDLGSRRTGARLTAFWNVLNDPIVNVTTGANARQRQNLGQARIAGLEASGQWSFAPEWTLYGAYTYATSDVTDAPGQPLLLHKQLPQSPPHQGNVGIAYSVPRAVNASAQLRVIGAQYEDDVNSLPMAEAVLVDLFAAIPVNRFLEVYAAIENLFDQTYLVGRAGVDTVGQPRFVHGGIRLRTGT